MEILNFKIFVTASQKTLSQLLISLWRQSLSMKIINILSKRKFKIFMETLYLQVILWLICLQQAEKMTSNQ